MASAHPTHVDAADYLARERVADEKHVLWDGVVYAMAGASPRHNLLVAAILAELGVALRGKPCRPFASDQRIRIPKTERYVYPDATILCPPFEVDPNDASTLMNPRVVVEVLSALTEAFDRGEKFIGYRTIPSLEHVLLVAQDEPRIEHFARDAEDEGVWRLVTARGGERVRLGSLGVELVVDALYAGMG